MKSRLLISLLFVIAILATLATAVGTMLATAPNVQHTRLSTDNPITALDISPDDQLLAAGVQVDQLNRGTVAQIWNLGRLEDLPIGLPGTSSSKALAFSPDSKLLAIGHQDGTITIWNRAGLSSTPPKAYRTLSTHTTDTVGVSALVFSPDGLKLFSAGPGSSIYIWDMGKMSLLTSLPSDKGIIFSLAVNSKGTLLASGDNDGIVAVWDLSRPTQEQLRLTGQEGIFSVAFSPDDSMLASAGLGGTIFLRNSSSLLTPPTILDTHPGEQRKYLTDFAIHSVQFSPDGTYLAAGSSDQTVYIWDVRNTNKRPFVLGMHAGAISTVRYSKDSQVLAAASSPFIYLWQVGTYFYRTKP